MYQISTSSALVEGVYAGSVSSSTLLKHGNFGLGTFEALSGEMVVLDGLIYQIAGEVRVRSDDFLVPFAAVTRFHEDFTFEVGPFASLPELEAACDRHRQSEISFMFCDSTVSSRHFTRVQYIPFQTAPDCWMLRRPNSSSNFTSSRERWSAFGHRDIQARLPWAIAASIVRPQEKVLSISGDGGFLFSAAELETAVRLNSHLVHMIWVDGHYDMVATQERIKYGRTSGVDLGPVDYIKYAEAFGATGFHIRDAGEIAPTLKKAFDTAGPVLIEVQIDYRGNAKLFESVHEGTIV